MSQTYHPRLMVVKVETAPPTDPMVLEAIVRKFEDGSLFMLWTGGGSGEPIPANMVFYSKSFDNGETWTEPKILFSHPVKGMFAPAAYVEGNSMYLFPDSYFYRFHHDLQTYMSFSHDSGETFSSPNSLPGGFNSFHVKCTRNYNGKWMFPCSWIEKDTDLWANDFYAKIVPSLKKCIVAGKEYDLTDVRYDIGYTEYCGVLVSEDKGKSWRLNGRIGRKGQSFVEPTMIDLSDGTLVMLLRTGVNYIYESRSTDGGETWSEPEQTNIPSAISKAVLLKDSRGRIYLMFNPKQMRHRSPLSLWISDDDMKTWGKKYDLVTDDENWVCYPDGFIDEERGKLCFAWDDRSHIYYSEFPLDCPEG